MVQRLKPPNIKTNNLKTSKEKAILVGVEFPSNGSTPTNLSMNELKSLAETAHYNPIALISQKKIAVNPKTLIGKGKVVEVKQVLNHFSAELVIFDENLSPAQNKNLETALKCRVIDRSWLILEIFRNHARSREAKTQVELARLKYALPRLTKMWGHLSRQRGGIGMRDVGETQIQLDRRLIRNQITKLNRKLKQIDREKNIQRKNRRNVFKVALVGYTNAGKSTLMNKLTGSKTLVEDKLFATLDSTIRKIKKNFPYPIIVSDTVGLIDKLPHDLIASFKSTLDEVRDADLLLKLVDISDPNADRQVQTTTKVINELGVQDTHSLLVLNKADKLNNLAIPPLLIQRNPEAILISSKNGNGINNLNSEIIRSYEKKLSPLIIKINYEQAPLISKIRKHVIIINIEYEETLIRLYLKLPPGGIGKVNEILGGKSEINKEGA